MQDDTSTVTAPEISAPGISVVVCTHNGAARLPQVLTHLRAQQTPTPWELVVVDNASTDDTAGVVRQHWEGSPVPLTVVHEPQPGLNHARKRGIAAAKYGLISFVDDDNWLAPDWLTKVANIMAQHPEVAACGGRTEAVFESPPPAWFPQYQAQWVIGTQGDVHGDITETRGHLWGAGITLRKRALDDLERNGFRATLVGRTGKTLISGEDYELCYALRMAGWHLWYEPGLVLRHHMPSGRINWDYLRRLNRGHGATSVRFDPYERVLGMSRRSIVSVAGSTWVPEALKSLAKAAILWTWMTIRGTVSRLEGSPWVLTAELNLGRFQELLRMRGEYDRSLRDIGTAPWARKTPPSLHR